MNTIDDQIGIDESGKGDYFGPLVIAGVYVPSVQEDQLRAMGVRDSKTLSDAKATALATRIRSQCPHTVVAIGPERYNALHTSMKNLNRMLAWGHARAIENLLEKVDCHRVVADQFGDERFLKNALMAKGREVTLIQKPRAEEEVAVAAASILARAEFLRRLQELGSKYGVTLPKGASDSVIQAAKAFVQKYGAEALGQVAKLHFRTTQSVLGNNS
ncbi:MAG: ribonuclease HIII [Deltaproteobacteria bacterium]|nr:ribonuclease HIII [Deltaproteobacteria bacterium]